MSRTTKAPAVKDRYRLTDDRRIVQVWSGVSGEIYACDVDAGKCPCRGFEFRKSCRHLSGAREYRAWRDDVAAVRGGQGASPAPRASRSEVLSALRDGSLSWVG